MNIFNLAWKNFVFKPLTNGLSIFILGLGVALILIINQINQTIDQKFTKNIKGIDMVVGAKGSPLQLILSSVFHLDSPTGNINLAETNFISKNPFVKTAIPIALGDNFKGQRIVGTQNSFLVHYQLKVQTGAVFKNPFECTIGYNVAQKLGLKIDQTFESTHGLVAQNDDHHTQKYKIVGVFEPSNSIADELIITSLESVWEIHNHEEDRKPNALDLLEENHEHHDTEVHLENKSKEITALLVKFRNPMGLMTIPRNINANSTFQAALPAIEVNRLFSLLGVGTDALQWLAYIIIFVAAISVFITVYNSLKERKYEMALMLTMGAKKTTLFFLLFVEAFFVGLFGYLLGKMLSLLALYFLNSTSQQSYNQTFNTAIFNKGDIFALCICLLVCIVAAYLPSLKLYKLDISKTLSEG